MVLMNTTNKDIELDGSRYKEITEGFNSAMNVISKEKVTDISRFKFKPNQTLILELKQ